MAATSTAIPPELLVTVERYAVYRCFTDQGELLYIGETGDLAKRLGDHAKKLWFAQVRGITLEWYADELDALNAERRAIHVEHPKYNVIHRNATVLSSPKPQARGARQPARRPQARTFDGLVADARAYRRELAAAGNGERLTKERLRLRLGIGSAKALKVLQALNESASGMAEAVGQ